MVPSYINYGRLWYWLYAKKSADRIKKMEKSETGTKASTEDGRANNRKLSLSFILKNLTLPIKIPKAT